MIRVIQGAKNIPLTSHPCFRYSSLITVWVWLWNSPMKSINPTARIYVISGRSGNTGSKNQYQNLYNTNPQEKELYNTIAAAITRKRIKVTMIIIFKLILYIPIRWILFKFSFITFVQFLEQSEASVFKQCEWFMDLVVVSPEEFFTECWRVFISQVIQFLKGGFCFECRDW